MRFCCQPLNIFVEADSKNNESISGVSGTHRCESINDGDNVLRLSNANFNFELAMEHISDNIPIYSIYDLPSCFTSEGYTTHDVKQKIYNKNGKFLLDLFAVNIQQALDAGLLFENIFPSDECTFCSPRNYFSYRREGQTGRILTFIMLQKSGLT